MTAARSVSLPRLLSLLPKDGLHSTVYQSRWAAKGLPVPSSPSTLDSSSRWEVKKVRLNLDGKVTGKAWGVLYWKGKRITPEDKLEVIKGGLKYGWSSATPPPLLVDEARKLKAEASEKAAEA